MLLCAQRAQWGVSSLRMRAEVQVEPDRTLAFVSRLDTPAFYKEARRVLKPAGALAAWCYTFPEIEHHAGADAVLKDFRSSVLGPHLPEVSVRCERQYKGIEPSAEEFGTVVWDAMPFRQESSVWHVVSLDTPCLLQATGALQMRGTCLAAGCVCAMLMSARHKSTGMMVPRSTTDAGWRVSEHADAPLCACKKESQADVMVATSFNLCTIVLASKLDKALLLPWESDITAGSTDLEEGRILSNKPMRSIYTRIYKKGRILGLMSH